MASPLRAVLHRRRFPGPLPKILTGRNAGSHPPKPPNSQPSQFSSPRLPPAGRIGPGGFLSSRTPPYAQHLLTARPATAPLSAGAGANPIYRPGRARPARMRLRLTPPDCALPSPARPPRRPARRALPSVRARPPGGAGARSSWPSVRVHLRSTSPACAARRPEGVSQRLLLRGLAPRRSASASPASTFQFPPALNSRTPAV